MFGDKEMKARRDIEKSDILADKAIQWKDGRNKIDACGEMRKS